MSAELLKRANHSGKAFVTRAPQVRPNFVGLALVVLSIFLLVTGDWTQSTGTSAQITPVKAHPGAEARVRQVFGRLPLSFEVSQGQRDSRVSSPPPGKSAPPDATNYVRSPISEDTAPKVVTTPGPNRPEGKKRRHARSASPKPRATPTKDPSTGDSAR